MDGTRQRQKKVRGGEVREWLESLEMSQYADVVVEAGYCFVQDLAGAEQEELQKLATECDFRKPEMRRLIHALELLRQAEDDHAAEVDDLQTQLQEKSRALADLQVQLWAARQPQQPEPQPEPQPTTTMSGSSTAATDSSEVQRVKTPKRAVSASGRRASRRSASPALSNSTHSVDTTTATSAAWRDNSAPPPSPRETVDDDLAPNDEEDHQVTSSDKGTHISFVSSVHCR